MINISFKKFSLMMSTVGKTRKSDCLAISFAAEAVMKARQMNINKDRITEEASSHNIDVLNAIVDDAFCYPVAGSSVGRAALIKDFKKRWFTTCSCDLA
jgi:hypothetical protein